jgi:hypothetical protein
MHACRLERRERRIYRSRVNAGAAVLLVLLVTAGEGQDRDDPRMRPPASPLLRRLVTNRPSPNRALSTGR